MSRGYTPRYGQTTGDLSFPCAIWCILRSSAILGSDSPQSNNRKDNSLWVTPFIPRERCQTHYCRLFTCDMFKATTAYISASTDAGAASAPLLSGGARVRHWQSARWLWPDTRRLQLSREYTPRYGQTTGDLSFPCAIQCWNSVAFCAAPLSSGRIVPRVTIGRITPSG